jgi:hypothetical protein
MAAAAGNRGAESSPPMSVADERTSWIVLGLAIAAYAALALWLTRGTTLYSDEVNFFQGSGFEPKSLLTPINGHLLLIPHTIYTVVLELVGPEYTAFRIIEVVGVALVAVLFFVLAKRRIGGPGALAPALVLLFLGTSWEMTLSPFGIPFVYAVAAGLGAFLALDRGDRRGDVAACALLVIAVGTHSVGLAFLAAAGACVLLRPDRWRRAWTCLVPLALYGAWFLAKPSLETPLSGGTSGIDLSNLPQLPQFIANSAAAVALAITGLNYDFSADTSFVPGNTDPIWGPILAAVAGIALLVRLRRGRVPPSLWAAIVLLLALWTGFGLTGFSVRVAGVPSPLGTPRSPEAARYMYPGAVAALIVAVEAMRGVRLSRGALLAVFGLAAVSLAFNTAHLFQGATWLRSYSAAARGQFTVVELARDRIEPNFAPSAVAPFLLPVVNPGLYLTAVDRVGSPAFTPAELERQSERVRQLADQILSAEAVGFSVEPPGALLRTRGRAQVALGRFAGAASVQVGSLRPGRPAVLAIPADRSPRPWHVTVTSVAPGRITACELKDGA